MRKHFLILMLTALLPLVGWAAAPAVKTAPAAKTLTYNGAAQELVTAGVLADDAVEGTEIYYAVVNHGAAAPGDGAYATAIPTRTDYLAGGYDVYYQTRVGASKSEAAVVVVTIAKADLLVKAKNKTTFYTGVAQGLEVEYGDFQGADDESIFDADGMQTVAQWPSVATTQTNAGTYSLKPTVGTVTPNNYNLVFVAGTLKIDPAKIKIAVINPAAVTYGDANWNKQSWDVTIADPTALLNIYVQNNIVDGEVVYNNTPLTAGNIAGKLKAKAAPNADKLMITITRPDSPLPGTSTITVSGAEAENNYAIGEYVNGTYTINAKAITVTPDNNTKVYGEATDPALTYTPDAALAELSDAEKAQIVATRVEGEDVGTYNITVSGPETIKGYALTYDNAIPGKFIITKRPVTITAANQMLQTGQTVANLDKAAVTKTNLVGNDDILLDWAFSGGVAGNLTGEGVLKMSAGHEADDTEDIAGGIEISVKAGEEYPNYAITLVPGKLTVLNLATALLLDDNDATLTDKLTAANGKNRNVSFGSRALKAETWNVLVLPFATSVKEISEAFGYAVVDILDQTASDGNVHLKLHMGAIPANTPFIVKNYEDKNLNLTGLYAGKKIEYTAAGENVSVEDAAGNKFVGTYKTTEVYGANIQYMTGKGVFKDAGAYTDASPLTLKPLRAYLQTVAQNNAGAAPIIFIEEPDGSTTAIETVNAVKVANGNDAIYNLAGQKVGASFKGIVIKNGKRYVQK